VGMLGYVNLANTIQSAQVGAANLAITAANVGMKGYVDSAVSTANIGIKGYTDLANTIQSAQMTAANVGVIGYIGQQVTNANTGIKGYVDSQSFYSNVKVATYLPTYDGNIAANISKAGYTWTFGTNGTTQFPGSMILAPVSQSITMQSDQYSQLMWENANVTVAPNMAINSNFYVAQNSATLDIGYRDGSGTQLIKSWLWSVDGNLTLPSGGYILNSDNSIYGGGNYSNVEVATYLQSGNIANISVAGNVTATYFVGNGALLTGVAIKTTGSWTVPTGNSTQSFTVPASGTYQLFVDCNIPNGILAWNATATVTNSNVPVVGQQFAWVYNGGGTPIDFTSIPNQFVGTGNTIVRSSVSPSVTTNRFDFGINNTSGGNVTVSYGYVKIS